MMFLQLLLICSLALSVSTKSKRHGYNNRGQDCEEEEADSCQEVEQDGDEGRKPKDATSRPANFILYNQGASYSSHPGSKIINNNKKVQLNCILIVTSSSKCLGRGAFAQSADRESTLDIAGGGGGSIVLPFIPYGDAQSNGNGKGNGKGNGNGNGNGYDNGNGKGYDYGDGNGNGNGYDNEDGNGYDNGDGNGNGNGDVEENYNGDAQNENGEQNEVVGLEDNTYTDGTMKTEGRKHKRGALRANESLKSMGRKVNTKKVHRTNEHGVVLRTNEHGVALRTNEVEESPYVLYLLL